MTSFDDKALRGLANAFNDAIAKRDLGAMRKLFAPDAKFWTNIGQADTGLDARMERIALEFKVFESFAFAEPRIDAFPGGFVLRARASGSVRGERFEFPICVVADVRGGRMVRFEEYVDPAPVQPILAALQVASGEAGAG